MTGVQTCALPICFPVTIPTNAHELINLLTRLNITNDPKLEQARRDLSAALTNTDLDTLKESDYIRENVKAKVDDILKRFDW